MFKKAFDHVSSHVTVWTWVFGGGVMSAGTVSGVVAKATGWIAPWGPIGWWACALVGALLGAVIFAIATKAYTILLEARLKRKLYGNNDRINPLDNHFERKRINLLELAHPFDPRVKAKTFRNCDLIGPCNVVLLGRTTVANNGGAMVQGVIVKDNTQLFNCISFEDCSIEDCRLYQVTFFLPLELKEGFDKGNAGGMHWITN